MQGIQTRLNLSEQQQPLIEELMEALSRAERQAYQRWQTGAWKPEETMGKLQSEHGLTSHQAAAVFKRVEQWQSMDEETHSWRLSEAELRLKKSKAKLAAWQAELLRHTKAGKFAKPTRLAGLKTQLFHARRRRDRDQQQVTALQDTLNSQSFSRVFGGRKLLQQRARLDSPDSPWRNEQAWREEWDRKRKKALWIPGRGGESFGNQSMQWNPVAGTLTIRLTETQAQRRLQDEADRLGLPVEKVKNRLSFKRLVLTEVNLCPKFKAMLQQAQSLKQPIAIQLCRKPLPASVQQSERLNAQLRSFSRGPGHHGPKRKWKTNRAQKQSKAARLKNAQPKADAAKAAAPPTQFGWYLHASFDLPKANLATSRVQGVLGIDFNGWGVAWCITTPDGNVLKDEQKRPLKGNIELPLRDKTSRQAKAIVLQAVKELVALAERYKVTIAHEDLDFTRAKVSMTEKGKGYSRMLSGLKTSGFAQALRSRAAKQGIPVHAVDPSWTSISGFAKYALRNAFSIDQAAAFAIARKALLGKEPESFSKPVPTHSQKDGKKLNPKFQRALLAKRESYVLKYDEVVCFAQPVPRVFQRKNSGQTKLTWQDVRNGLGRDRRSWVKTLARPPDQSPKGTPAARPPGRTVVRSRTVRNPLKEGLASPLSQKTGSSNVGTPVSTG
jgi:IS605 OrfB family transposase